MKRPLAIVGLSIVLATAAPEAATQRPLHSQCGVALSDRLGLADTLYGEETLPSRVQTWFTASHPATVAVVSLLPTNAADYRNVFPEKPISSVVEKEISSVVGANSEMASVRSWAAVRAIVESTPESVIVLLAHSDGESLRTPDGEGASVETVLEACAGTGKVCVIVACKSAASIAAAPPRVAIAGIGLAGNIEMERAVALVRKLKEQIQATPNITPEELKQTLSRLESSARIATYARSAICHGIEALVAGLLVYEVTQLEQSELACRGSVLDATPERVRLKGGDGVIVVHINKQAHGTLGELRKGDVAEGICRKNGSNLLAVEIHRLGQ
jgi:hypothetical protein